MSDSPQSAERERTERFVQLFARHEANLYSYIVTLILNDADAEEVLQETSLLLWRKFDDFQPGTDFAAWSCRIAYFEVLKFRRGRHRDHLTFGEAFIEKIEEQTAAMRDELGDRSRALAGCIGKLRDDDRELIHRRYGLGETIEQISGLLGRPAKSVYKSLSRIRGALAECIERTIRREEGP